LILELVRFGHVEAENPLHRAIGTAFLAMLGEAKPLPHMLAMPIDRRAQRVAAAIVADPAARDVPLVLAIPVQAPSSTLSAKSSVKRLRYSGRQAAPGSRDARFRAIHGCVE